MLQASCKEGSGATLQRNLLKVKQASHIFLRPACSQTPGSPHAPSPLMPKVGVSVQCRGRVFSMQAKGSGLVPAGE